MRGEEWVNYACDEHQAWFLFSKISECIQSPHYFKLKCKK